jgi:hypothetical protein
MLDPLSQVTHNETLMDRVGNKRQYDVVIRGHFAGRAILGVVECKDHNRKKGPAEVEAFAKKTENLGANLRLMVSRKGFTKQALKLARFEHIGCLSLLQDDPKLEGFPIGHWRYGVLRQWTDVFITVIFALEKPPVPEGFPSDSVLWQGRPVSNWFQKELLTTYGSETREGNYCLVVEFDGAQSLQIEGKEYPVNGLTCSATRVCRKKRKWVSWSGDGLYNWHTRQLTLPAGGKIVGSPVETDLALWDDYNGEIPEVGEVEGRLTVVAYDLQEWDDSKEVVDLTKLCPHPKLHGPLPLFC